MLKNQYRGSVGCKILGLLLAALLLMASAPLGAMAGDIDDHQLRLDSLVGSATDPTGKRAEAPSTKLEEAAGESGWVELDGVYHYVSSSGKVDAFNPSWLTDAFCYYGKQLDANAKLLYEKYRDVDQANLSFEMELTGGLAEVSDLADRALTAYLADYPHRRDMLSGLCHVEQIEEGVYRFTLDMWSSWTGYSHKKAAARVDQILASMPEDYDRYTRVRYLFNVLQTSARYNPWHPHADDLMGVSDQRMSGVLCGGVGVCAGFADALKALCDGAGVPCIQVGNAGHAWNFVQMEDGRWYSIDASISIGLFYGDGGDLSEFYLLGSESQRYADNGNYSLGELYMGRPGWFDFPALPVSAYAYSGSQSDPGYEVSADLEFEYDSNRFEYSVNDDGASCTITGYFGERAGDLVVPEEIDGYIVTAVGRGAYAYCHEFTGRLILPNTVEEIADDAFVFCEGLTGIVELPSSLKTVGQSAFLACTSLEGVVFNESLESVGRQAFLGCLSLAGDIILPDSLSFLGDLAFAYDRELDGAFRIPAGLDFNAHITESTSISSFVLADDAEAYLIYEGVLYSADGKTLICCPPGKRGELIIREGVETIAAAACYQCYYLSGDLVIPSSVREIGRFAFCAMGYYSESGVDSITIQGSVDIADNAFQSIFSKEGQLLLAPVLTVQQPVTAVDNPAFVAGGEVRICCNDPLLCELFAGEEYENSFVTIEHSWDPASGVVTPPTESADGYTTYQCDRCSNTFQDNYTLSLGGSLSEWISVVNASCTKPGLSVQYSIPGNHVINRKVVNALGHLWGDASVIVAPTLETEGMGRVQCDRCATLEERVIPRLKRAEAPAVIPDLVYTGLPQFGVAGGEGYELSGDYFAIDAGSYGAVATLRYGYAWSDGSTDPKTIEWSISRAKVDMSDVSFDGDTVTYDGEPHSISVTGELPEGVSVSYEGNDPVRAGSHRVVAVFSCDENHVAPEPMTAVLMIEPAVLTAVYAGESVEWGGDPVLSVAVEGFVGGETAETAEGYVAPRVTAPIMLEAGSYELVPAGGSAANYSFVYLPGTLVVLEPAFPAPDPEPEPDPAPGPAPAPSDLWKNFPDVKKEVEGAGGPEKVWYVADGWLDYVVNAGLMGGYSSNGYFGAYDNITRGQVAVILYRSECAKDPSLIEQFGSTTDPNMYAIHCEFKDMRAREYYTAAINWAKAVGIMTGDAGTGYTTVRPNDSVARQELCLMLARFANDGVVPSVELDPAKAKGIKGMDKIAPWARDGVYWAVNNGVIGGVSNGDGTFSMDPTGKTWRSAAAKMFTVVMRDVL